MRKSILLILSTLVLASACKQHSEYIQISGYAQGGTYRVVCPVESISRAQELKDGIDSILNVIDYSVSGYNPESLLSRYNKGEEVGSDGPGAEVFRNLCRIADSLYVATGGVVDCRSAALFDIWGFGFKEGHMPSQDDINAARANRNKLNFNAIAQGYSCDLVAGYLERHGITDMLVDVGGEMVCRGCNPKGKGWTIGIDTPEDGLAPGEKSSGNFTMDPDRDRAVVTSGNYRKFYIEDGVKYSHTIDPRSGRPVRHTLLSATVLADNSTVADALATYCMVVGMDSARVFIESRPDLDACLISADEVWTSDGLKLNQ